MLTRGRLALTAGALAVAGGVTNGATIYNYAGTANRARGQVGFNAAYYGDDVTAPAPAGGDYRLDTVTMRFGLLAYADGRYQSETVSAFTPSIQLDIFAIDPSTRIPTGDRLATTTVSDRTFQPAVVNSFGEFFTNPNLQNVTFDFTSQNVLLPDDFAFVYRVPTGTAADGVITDEMNLFNSIASTSGSAGATVGSTQTGHLVAYPNNPSNFGWAFNGSPPENDPSGQGIRDFIGTVEATFVPIPEPAALGLVSLAGLALTRRSRVRRR